MHGNKDEKRARLERIAAAVAQAPGGVTLAGLARALGVSRATVSKDLVALERLGVRLAEDERGRVSLFRRSIRHGCD